MPTAKNGEKPISDSHLHPQKTVIWISFGWGLRAPAPRGQKFYACRERKFTHEIALGGRDLSDLPRNAFW